ncbi:MAG: vanadium-dependent haloperoxidase [Saprospiraceae bacterium]|jgi:hypothetical protein|nr:vanadium-dependent haloperoxidase [Saprospiraceae bacterium]
MRFIKFQLKKINTIVAFSLVVILAVLLVYSCKNESKTDYMKAAANPEYLHRSVKSYTDVIISDLFSPPVSSRNYAYPSIAAYEVLRNLKPEYKSMKGQLNDFPEIPILPQGQTICLPLSAIQAFHATAKKFIFSEADLVSGHTQILKEMAELGIPKDVFDNSVAYGNKVAEAIKKWADTDNYKQTRSMPKHTTSFKEGAWRPTPPDYLDALEPNWFKMRSFVFDSTGMIEAEGPIPFSKDPKSTFYDQASEIRAIGNALKPEQIAIAKFWDDNPVVSIHNGHAIHDAKKMTPAGHWMNINRQACEKSKADILTASESYLYVSLALFEGFRSCWYTKYKYDLIRPETYINQYMDSKWKPYLQTPPFPEHTSGHSTISAASAAVCTYLYGQNFALTDSTENEYGNGVRSFPSFYEAALEASVSRVYGGIHYRHGCDTGNRHGLQIGTYILQKIVTRPRAVGMK